MEVRVALNAVLDNKLKGADLPPVTTITKSLPSWLKRSEWKRLPFGAFADSIGERVEPIDAAEEIYVGLDDLDSGSLHIRRWGKGSDVIGTKLRFRKGDIIFGRRRAYQRKLAVAEMDGICSAHAMVVRAKPDMVLPEFLPFLMLSDKFMNRAVEISVGSLSPTINWTTLKHEEFVLPPLDQQRRIAEIFWAVDECFQDWYVAALAANKQHQAVVADFILTHQSSNETIGEYLEEVQYGSSRKAILQPRPGLVPLLRIPNVIGGKVDFTDLVWFEPNEESEKYQLVPGDVLIVRTNGNPDYVGRTAVYEGSKYEECLFASYLIRLRPKPEKLMPHYLHEILQSTQLKRDIRKYVKSSAGNYNLNTQGIRGLCIPLTSKKTQETLLGRLESLDSVGAGATQHAENLNALRLALLKSVFNMDSP